MAATPTEVASTDGVHADLHEHLERIYTSITTTEERVWIEPYKNIFQDITTALLECDLSDTKSRIRTNKIINHNVLLFEGMPLRSRHDEGSINPEAYSSLKSALFALTDWTKALPLDVWFQCVLQYTSEKLILHSTRIAQTFPGMSDVLDVLDDGVDALNTNISDSQSEFQFEDFLVATTETLYGCVVRCYGAGLHRDIISDEFHGVRTLLYSCDFFCMLFEKQHDKMGTFLRRTKNHAIMVMQKFSSNLTRSNIRRWIPLILTAVHLLSPITEWVNCENSMHHRPPTSSSTCPQHCGSDICFRHGWLPLAFTHTMKVLFVEITAVVVMKHQMRHIVVPMAKRAINGQVTTPSVGDEAITAVDDLQSNIFNNTDAPALSFQFLVDSDANVLTKLCSFVTLLTEHTEASKYCLEHQLKTLIMVHLAVDPADAVAVPTPSIVHENSTIGSVASIEESSLSSDVAPPDSVDGSGATHTVHSLLHHLLHQASHDRLRRFLCGGAAHPYLVVQIKTQPPSKNSIIAAKVQGKGNDTNRSELVQLLRIARGLCVSRTTTFEYWHLLSIGEQPQNLGSVGIRCICDIISATTESLLMSAYSSTVREASTQQHQHQHQSTDTHQDTSPPQHTRLPSNVQHEAVIALIETAIHCTWRMEELGNLDELNTMMTTTMKKLLAQLPPEATREYHCVILEAIHNYLLTAQSNIHNAPATQTGVVDATRSIITLMNHVELRAALKLTLFINEEQPFFRHMDAALRVRLLSRPPPSSNFDDNVFEKQRHQLETDVLNYLSNYYGCKEQVQRMLNVCDTFHSAHFISHTSPPTPIANVTDMRPASQPSHVPLPPTSLVVHVLDMRHWGYHLSTYLVIQQKSNSTTRTTVAYTNTSSTVPKNNSSDAEELPFPADLAAALVDYTHEYQQQQHHEQRQLHWCRDYAYTTFEVYYPQDGGLPTTIHGTLLLQRLFVALVEYKRVGVTWSHLAARAHMSVEELKEQLHKCVELSLLVCVGKDDKSEEGHGVEYVAMNYDYVRPVESTDRVIALWPEPLRHVRDMVAARRTITDAQRVEQLAPVVMSIMKERKRIRYSELFHLVCGAEHTIVVPTWAMFKACVEGLIDRHYLSRIVQNGGLPVLNASIMLEYVP